MNPNSRGRVLRVVLGALLVAVVAQSENQAVAQATGKQPKGQAQQPQSDAQQPPSDTRPPPSDTQPPPGDASSRGTFKSPAVPIRRLPPVASKGGCEPHYRNGMVGSCINDKPCRGFGVREQDGSAQCICYIRRGGCNEDERCSPEEGQCVADDESEFNREH